MRPVSRLLITLLIAAVLSGSAFVLATRAGTEQPPVGRYTAVAPDLVLDTATGRLTDVKGTVVSAAVDASGSQVGRYHAAGYVTTVVRRIWVDILSRGQADIQVVKGFTLVDTTTGNAVKEMRLTPFSLRCSSKRRPSPGLSKTFA